MENRYNTTHVKNMKIFQYPDKHERKKTIQKEIKLGCPED